MIEKEELFHLLSLHARDAFLFTCISDHKRYKIIKSNVFMNFKEAFMVFSRF